MTMRFDVVIVGGGMVGATLACALGNSRLKVALLDARAPTLQSSAEYDLRVSAITLASRTLFENLGAWEGMRRRRVAPVEAMHIWEQPDGSAVNGARIQFHAADIGADCLAHIIENSVIQQALVERLQTFTNIQLLWPVTIQSIETTESSARVTLADGRQLDAALLVGADGAESAVRQAAGIGARQQDVHQKGIVATVRTERTHDYTARQRFLGTGPLAFLPLAESHTSSIVWSVDTPQADELMRLDTVAFTAALQSAFGDALGRIESVSTRQAFALALSHAHAYSAERVALIGDAAHTVHPLAGQGVNLGFMDAAALAQQLLEAAARHRDLGGRALLRRYERSRKSENLGMIAVTGGFKYFFGASWGSAWGGIPWLRRTALALTEKATPIKRALMRRASGLDGDLPALATRNHTNK